MSLQARLLVNLNLIINMNTGFTIPFSMGIQSVLNMSSILTAMKNKFGKFFFNLITADEN